MSRGSACCVSLGCCERLRTFEHLANVRQRLHGLWPLSLRGSPMWRKKWETIAGLSDLERLGLILRELISISHVLRLIALLLTLITLRMWWPVIAGWFR